MQMKFDGNENEDVELLEKRVEKFEARGWDAAAERNREKLERARESTEEESEYDAEFEALCERIRVLTNRDGWEAAEEAARDRLEAHTGHRDPDDIDDYDALSVDMSQSDVELGLEESRIERKIKSLKKKIRRNKSKSMRSGKVRELQKELAYWEDKR